MCLVSVIIPCFNALRWIRSAVDSVLGQGGIPCPEVIVVDDGSSDGTGDLVAREYPDALLLRTGNQGASRARNLGTDRASGTWIQYLDSDDLLGTNKLRLQLEALDRSGADVSYGDWQSLLPDDAGGFRVEEIESRGTMDDPEIDLFTTFWCPPAAYLFRRSMVDAVGGWNEGLPVIQDARFALDCALHGAKFVRCEGTMAFYRTHPNSLSRRDPMAFNRDVYRNACEVREIWGRRGVLNGSRRKAVVGVLGQVARASFGKDEATFERAYSDLVNLTGRYVPEGPRHLAVATRLFGYRRAESLAARYHRVKRAVSV